MSDELRLGPVWSAPVYATPVLPWEAAVTIVFGRLLAGEERLWQAGVDALTLVNDLGDAEIHGDRHQRIRFVGLSLMQDVPE